MYVLLIILVSGPLNTDLKFPTLEACTSVQERIEFRAKNEWTGPVKFIAHCVKQQ